MHHPLAGAFIAARIIVMPGTRGSCTESGVLLEMALNGRAPAALVFSESEDVATLGALIAAEMFGMTVPVLRVAPAVLSRLKQAKAARIGAEAVEVEGMRIPVARRVAETLALSSTDRIMLAGEAVEAAALTTRILCATAANQGAMRLIDVTRGHIDGCIHASPANLTFKERMADMGGACASRPR